MNGPNSCRVPSGDMTETTKPTKRLDAGGGGETEKFSMSVWPTPTGFGATTKPQTVGMETTCPEAEKGKQRLRLPNSKRTTRAAGSGFAISVTDELLSAFA